MRRLLAALTAGLSLLAAAPASATPGDPYAPEYYVDRWHAQRLWARGADGRGITIAVIDTGVDAAQPELRGRVVAGKDFGSLGGDGRTDRDTADYGHGTSMASIMVGRPGRFGIQGLAPGAKVLPIAVPLRGTTDAADNDHLPEAIRWAADHGANVISMSLGGVRRPATSSQACPEDEQAAIFHALRRGAMVLAAGGNRGRQGSDVEEPGVCIGVVAVGAVDRSGAVADFSSRVRYLTLAAPGVDIASIGKGSSPFVANGTSQATAIASAAAALVWSAYPGLSADRVVARLLATLDDRRATPDTAFGYGIINPYRGVLADVPASAPNPVAALAAPFVRRTVRSPSVAAPAPIQRADHPPGTFAIGTRPVRTGIFSIGLAVAGALALLGLLAVGVVGRRRRRRTPAVTPAVAPTPIQ